MQFKIVKSVVVMAVITTIISINTTFAQSQSANYKLNNSFISGGSGAQGSESFSSNSSVVQTPQSSNSDNFQAVWDTSKPVDQIDQEPEEEVDLSSSNSSGSKISNKYLPEIQYLKIFTSNNSALVEFTTKNSYKTQLFYFQKGQQNLVTPVSPDYSTSHTFLLSNLEAETEYFFVISFYNKNDQQFYSQLYNFTTLNIETFIEKTPVKPLVLDYSNELDFSDLKVRPSATEKSDGTPDVKQESFDYSFNFYTFLDKNKPVEHSVNEKKYLIANENSLISFTINPIEVGIKNVIFQVEDTFYYLTNKAESPRYELFFKAPEAGRYKTKIKVIYNDNTYREVNVSLVVIQPGQVYVKKYQQWSFSNPVQYFIRKRVGVENAKIELQVLNKNGKYELWKDNFSIQKNPVYTNKNGNYTFFVPTNQYSLNLVYDNSSPYQFFMEPNNDGIINSDISLSSRINLRIAILIASCSVLLLTFVLKFRK